MTDPNSRIMNRAVVFIDASVEPCDTLASALPQGLEVHVLSREADGLAQIAAYLQAGSEDLPYDSVHIISHGSPGSVSLGDRIFDEETISNHKAALASIGECLATDADILLYGCDVASGPKGRAFIERLGILTGADVAASDDATGSSFLGGDAELEVTFGDVLTQQMLSRTDFDDLGMLLVAPPNSITPGSGVWLGDWNPFGNISRSNLSISSATEQDLYAFFADKVGSQTYTFTTGGALDTELRIYDNNGAPLGLVVDQTFGGETTQRTLTGGLWYYIAVTGDQSSTGNYTLTIDGPDLFSNPLGTPSAPNFVVSSSGDVSVSPGGDRDIWEVVAPSTATSVNIKVTPGPGTTLNTVLDMYRSSGQLMDSINSGGNGAADFQNGIPVTGGQTYYFGVSSIDRNQTGSYTLEVDFNPNQSLPVLSIAAISADKPEGTNQTTAFTFQVTRSGGNTSGTSTVHWRSTSIRARRRMRPTSVAAPFRAVT